MKVLAPLLSALITILRSTGPCKCHGAKWSRGARQGPALEGEGGLDAQGQVKGKLRTAAARRKGVLAFATHSSPGRRAHRDLDAAVGHAGRGRGAAPGDVLAHGARVRQEVGQLAGVKLLLARLAQRQQLQAPAGDAASSRCKRGRESAPRRDNRVIISGPGGTTWRLTWR